MSEALLIGGILGTFISIPFSAFRHNRAGGSLDATFLPKAQRALVATGVWTTALSCKKPDPQNHSTISDCKPRPSQPSVALDHQVHTAGLAGVGLLGLKEGWDKEKIEDRAYRLHYSGSQNRTDRFSEYGAAAGTAGAFLTGP